MEGLEGELRRIVLEEVVDFLVETGWYQMSVLLKDISSSEDEDEEEEEEEKEEEEGGW